MVANAQPLPRAAEQADFERLYASELPVVYGFLFRLGVHKADMEDLAHDVFVTAVKRWSTYDPSRPVRPWLLGIAYRVVLDSKRRLSGKMELPGPMPERATEENDSERQVEAREARDLLTRALEELPPERRASIIFYEIEGLSVAEIAEAMNVPAPTVYSRLRIGREELARAVQRLQPRRDPS
jgi:RNA polymerase sigma-70 factor (ECF subfamily)